ncbi:MAG: undecaprenyl-diphosphate phosphatase, partial [Myxococcota bacterium]
MNIADAVLLGVVQGLTEFLPVSSSGHLVLFEQFLDGFDLENALLFNVTLHLGTLLSVIVYYRRDLAGMARRVFLPPAPLAANRADSDPVPPTPPDRGYIGLIVLATFATALIAFPLRDLVDALFGSPRAGATLLADDAARLRVVGA